MGHRPKKVKKYRSHSGELKPLAVGLGACFATDRITVDGTLVGYCYKERPNTKIDSGWRFFAGDESEEYVSDPDKISLCDVNSIANFDPAILPILNAPIDSAFTRNANGEFILEDLHIPDD